MKKSAKLTALIIVLALVAGLAACSGTSKKEFKTWFNDELTAAYDAFVATEYGKANAPSPDISLMIVSSTYINSVFDYIADGTQPENAEITEENGMYFYKTDTFTQKVELDTKTTSVRVTSFINLLGETMVNSVVTFTERGGEYYIQYLLPEFSNYYEAKFTENNGSVKFENIAQPAYSIFGQDIPAEFAKEN